MIKKNILITGAAGFLGSHYLKHLVKKNNVFAVDINIHKLTLLKKKFKKIKIFKVDISNEKEVINLFKDIKKNFFINVLINNAAIDAIPSLNKKNRYPTVDAWDKEIGVSLTGSYLMTKFFGEEMYKKKEGNIVNIGSDLSIIAPNQNIYKSSFPNYIKPVTYSVIKHGLLGMTKYFASLYASHNVIVNMLSPGPILNKQNKKFLSELKKITPLGKIATRDDLLLALDFLIDTKNSHMTGHNLIVDGGRTIL